MLCSKYYVAIYVYTVLHILILLFSSNVSYFLKANVSYLRTENVMYLLTYPYIIVVQYISLLWLYKILMQCH